MSSTRTRSKNVRRLGWFAAVALGRVSLRRRMFSALIRRSKRIAKVVVVARFARRVLGTPEPSVVAVRTPRSIIDVEAR